jgi:type I restriction enzyme S subunit
MSLDDWKRRVPWLRKLSTEWKVARFRYLGTLTTIANDDHRNDLLSLSAVRGLVPKSFGAQADRPSGEDLRRYWVVKPGQLVVNPMWLSGGSIGVSMISGVISPDYRVYDLSSELHPRFAHYLLSSQVYLRLYDLFVRGTTTYDRRVAKEDFRELPVVVPPYDVQEEIVRLLDTRTTAVDALIRSRETLLSLYTEEVYSVAALGIGGEALRPSGIPWMPEIPSSWGVSRARFLFRQADRPVREDDGVVTAFRNGQVTLRSNRRVDGFTEAALEHGYQGVRAGDLVLHSMDAFAGAIGVSESDGKCTPEYIVCQPLQQGLDSHYYATVLRVMARQDYIRVACQAVRERAPRFRFATFRDISLPVPSPEEQAAIGARVRALSALAIRTRQEVSRLLEYRQALVATAILGVEEAASEVA